MDILRKDPILEIRYLNNAISKLSKIDFDNNDYLYNNKDEIFNKIKQTQYINDINSNLSIISMGGASGSTFTVTDIAVSEFNVNKNMAFQNISDTKNHITLISPILKEENNNFYDNMASFIFLGI